MIKNTYFHEPYIVYYNIKKRATLLIFEGGKILQCDAQKKSVL